MGSRINFHRGIRYSRDFGDLCRPLAMRRLDMERRSDKTTSGDADPGEAVNYPWKRMSSVVYRNRSDQGSPPSLHLIISKSLRQWNGVSLSVTQYGSQTISRSFYAGRDLTRYKVRIRAVGIERHSRHVKEARLAPFSFARARILGAHSSQYLAWNVIVAVH